MAELDIAPGTKAVLIAGPTASGKSGRAIDLAVRFGGVVVNADSMQVYAPLRLLTARPPPQDESRAPHRLYGHIPAAERYSVGRWLLDVAEVLATLRQRGQMPIIVGGTGLYFKALTEGLATVPPIPAPVREHWRLRGREEAPEALHAILAERDPESAAAIRPSDRVRIVRALEVLDGTGRSLIAWQRMANSPLPLVAPESATRIVIDPDRPALHERISARADQMVAAGALDEVRALPGLGIDPAFPAMKAIGVREFIDHFSGKLSLDEAVAAVKTETRRYAKRQSTWFRNQMRDWSVVPLGPEEGHLRGNGGAA
jgi:tRNA dimethylallyltransferase